MNYIYVVDNNSYVAIQNNNIIIVNSILKATRFNNKYLTKLFNKLFNNENIQVYCL